MRILEAKFPINTPKKPILLVLQIKPQLLRQLLSCLSDYYFFSVSVFIIRHQTPDLST